MKILTCSTLKNPKNTIIQFICSKKNKCQCGKTMDSNGNCDGSHAKK